MTMCGVASMHKASFTGLLSNFGLPGQDKAVQSSSTRSGQHVCPRGHLWGLDSLLERSEMHVIVHFLLLAIKYRLLKDLAGLVGSIAVSNEEGSMLRVQVLELSLRDKHHTWHHNSWTKLCTGNLDGRSWEGGLSQIAAPAGSLWV